MYCKEPTVLGHFPAEIWLGILDEMERSCSYKSIAHLSQCNKFLNDLAERHLYRTYTTYRLYGEAAGRSLAAYFDTICNSPRLASLVTTLRIDKIDSSTASKYSHHILEDAGQKIGIRVNKPALPSMSGFEQARIIINMLPCLLPNLKTLHLGLGIVGGVYKFQILCYWRDQSPDNRLRKLEVVKLDYGAEGTGIRPSDAPGLFSGVAPNIHTLFLRPRYVLTDMYVPRRLAQHHFCPALVPTLAKLRALHIDGNLPYTSREGMLIQHCPKLEVFSYLKGVWDVHRDIRNLPVNTHAFLSYQYREWPVLEHTMAAILPQPPDLNLLHCTSLKVAHIDYELLVRWHLADVPRDRRIFKKILPPSLTAFHLYGADRLPFLEYFYTIQPRLAGSHFPKLKELVFHTDADLAPESAIHSVLGRAMNQALSGLQLTPRVENSASRAWDG